MIRRLMKHTLFRNFFSAFIGEYSSAFLNLLIVIITIKLTTNNGYGMFVLAQSYTLIIDGLLNFQSWKVTITYGQKAIVDKDISLLYKTVFVSLIIDIITAIISGITSLLLLNMIISFMGWSNEIRGIIIVFSVGIFFNINGVSIGILRILNKFNYVAFQKVIVSFLKLLLIISFRPNDIFTIALIWVILDSIGNVLLLITALLVLFKLYYPKKYSDLSINRSDFKELMNYSIWTNLYGSVDMPIKYLDSFIISMYLSIEMVSVFKVFKQFASIFVKLVSPISQVFMPKFAELIALDKKQETVNMMKKMRNIILIFFIPSTILLGLTSKLWLGIFFDEIYVNYYLIFTLYLIIQSTSLSYATIHSLMDTFRLVKQSFYIALISNIVYVIVIFPLVINWQLTGLCIGIAIQNYVNIGLKYACVRIYSR